MWSRFKKRIPEIKNAVSQDRFGIVDCYPTDEHLVHFACVEVEDFSQIPDGMRAIMLPAAKFAFFYHCTNPSEIDQTLKYIYGSWLPKFTYVKANGPDVEIFPNDFVSGRSFKYGISIQSVKY